ncbi:nuclear transport factor 2-like protein [Salinimicrobium xinjiangense]|uniref:hypothetical protein n=1 Tax=Salinimicrobium xinjiangense TaxID=438596 RepID=UPI0003FB5F54|nr:hypothetical protein [Salinimicrobium xinjiangense]
MERAEEKKAKCWKVLIVMIGILLCWHPGLAQVDGNVSLEFDNKEEAMETAQETVRAYETGNWETLRKNVHDGAHFYNLGSYDSLSLEQTINYWKKGRETATPILSKDGAWLAVSVPEGPRKGNWILHWGNNTLRYPNGETISFPYHVAQKFKDSKVSEVHFYYDNNRIIRAMGYEIQPPMGIEEEDPEHPENKENDQ